MQIDVVRHLVVGMILQVKLHRIAFPHSDEATRRRAAKGPKRVAHTLRDFLFDLADLEFDDDLGRTCTVSGRRYIGRRREYRMNGSAQRHRFCRRR